MIQCCKCGGLGKGLVVQFVQVLYLVYIECRVGVWQGMHSLRCCVCILTSMGGCFLGACCCAGVGEGEVSCVFACFEEVG